MTTRSPIFRSLMSALAALFMTSVLGVSMTMTTSCLAVSTVTLPGLTALTVPVTCMASPWAVSAAASASVRNRQVRIRCVISLFVLSSVMVVTFRRGRRAAVQELLFLAFFFEFFRSFRIHLLHLLLFFKREPRELPNEAYQFPGVGVIVSGISEGRHAD